MVANHYRGLDLEAIAKQHNLPLLPVHKVDTKLKRFFWDKILPKDVKGSIWDAIVGSGGNGESGSHPKGEGTGSLGLASVVTVDWGTVGGELESAFAATAKNMSGAQEGEENVKEKVKTEKEKKVELLDAKRAYNISISLSRFTLSPEVIRDAVLAMDDNVLPVEKLAVLSKIYPFDDEVKLVQGFTGPIEKLAEVEYFFRIIADCPAFKPRMRAMEFLSDFPFAARRVDDALDHLEEAHKSLWENEAIIGILAFILEFGNYINASNTRSLAYGFRLSSLSKLVNMKSSDKRCRTLLHFLVCHIEKVRPEWMSFTDSIVSLSNASKIEPAFLRAEVKSMRQDLNHLQELIAQDNRMRKKLGIQSLQEELQEEEDRRVQEGTFSDDEEDDFLDDEHGSAPRTPAKTRRKAPRVVEGTGGLVYTVVSCDVLRFFNYATARFELLDARMQGVVNGSAELAKWFLEPDMPWDEFYTVWVKFMQEFKDAKQELDEERRRAKQEETQVAGLELIRQRRTLLMGMAKSKQQMQADGNNAEWDDSDEGVVGSPAFLKRARRMLHKSSDDKTPSGGSNIDRSSEKHDTSQKERKVDKSAKKKETQKRKTEKKERKDRAKFLGDEPYPAASVFI